MTRQFFENPQFYLTAPSECPYLEDRKERKVFTHLVGPNATSLNDVLSQGGFRRSQNIVYRPACEECSACVSVRVCASQFKMTRSFRRSWQRLRSVVGEELPPSASAEQYDLFQKYLAARHNDGGMSRMTLPEYALMIEDTHVETAIIEYRANTVDLNTGAHSQGPLLAVALTDRLIDGLSMVYSFFDPDFSEGSLGTHMILDHIERARSLALPYVYLGYWVNGSQKMAYKRRFQPQQHLGAAGWVEDDGEVEDDPLGQFGH
ncbi:arginyltransferase [Polycladidibacter hongkongensis]|uniref:arginyltransferase n=1 Tax=Polycladidibacter hongkongensis TaxID=1647556 RepID=UPI00082A2792|nr:arginyltransferase [Pseudovibrio hongkongensis]